MRTRGNTRTRRRGTVLIFVMAVLVLLALMGLGMMIATRGERQRIAPQREALAIETVKDRAVDIVRHRLREDIWGLESFNPGEFPNWTPLDRDPNKMNYTAEADGDPNSDEPWDAPGPEDRWLASAYPYLEPNATDPNGTGLRWHRVSYLGPIRGEPDPDASPPSNPTAPVDDPENPEDSELSNLLLRVGGMQIGDDPEGSIPRVSDPTALRWPYDGDNNGALDLYDADGDGIPDSPISFTFPVETPTPTDRPKQIGVAIRIVDNNAKVNVNTATSRFDPTASSVTGTGTTFNHVDAVADLQRRGRRPTEVLLDVVAKPDWTGHDPAYFGEPPEAPLVAFTRWVWWGGEGALPDLFDVYLSYYAESVRRQLVDGRISSSPSYAVQAYGLDAELSLAHRFNLVPYRYRNARDVRMDPNYVTTIGRLTGRIDLDLFYSLCWSPVPGSWGGFMFAPWYMYDPSRDLHHCRKFRLTEELDSANPGDQQPLGWRTLYDPEATPWTVRRGMLTAYNGESDRRPPNRRALDPDLGTTVYTVVLDGDDFKRRLSCTNDERIALGPDFDAGRPGAPSQASYAYPMRGEETDDPHVPAGLWDYEKVSLNYVIDPNGLADEVIRERKADYVTQLAWAFYVSNAISIEDLDNPVEAWRAAVNICDYRDADSVPTVVKDSSGAVIAVGIERQPFITEVHITRSKDSDGNLSETVQVEVYNPYSTEFDSGDFEVQVWSGGASLGTVTVPNLTSTSYTTVSISPSAELDQDTFNAKLVRPAGDGLDALLVDSQRLEPPYVSGTVTPWQAVGDDETKSENYQRCTQDAWGSSTAKATHAQAADTGEGISTLGLANRATIRLTTLSIAASHWVVRDTGLLARDPTDPNDVPKWHNHWWTFDTPGELSRCLVVGNRALANANAASGSLVSLQDPGPTYGDGEANVAAGRLDFFREDDSVGSTAKYVDPRNIFDYVTCLGANHDGIDNDGDGVPDELPEFGTDGDDVGTYAYDRSEADAINYRQVGRININTAPLPVLYSVPYMLDPGTNLTRPTIYAGQSGNPQWDLAAATVAWREGRDVVSVWDRSASPMKTVLPSDPDPNSFRNRGGLAKVRVNGSAGCPEGFYRADRWVQAAVGALEAYDPASATARNSPDFDGSDAAAPEAGDVHDGSEAVERDIRDRDILLARTASILTTRSDVYTVYIVLVDSQPNADGTPRYLGRCQFTLDRTNCFRDPLALPEVFNRVDSNYYDDTR